MEVVFRRSLDSLQLLEYWRMRSLALRERQQRLLRQVKETAIASE